MNRNKKVGIPRRTLEGPPVLSSAQMRLWFLDQLDPNNPAYNVPFAFRVAGSLDVSALERSLNEIVARHDVLRTTFRFLDDTPVQAIVPTMEIALPLIDLQNRPGPDQDKELAQILEAEAARPFSLAEGPLIRVFLVRLGPTEYVLFFHHAPYCF